jgi:hypothetical protein
MNMKRIILDFLRRGLTACGIGPLVLVILYLILQKTAGIETLTVQQVCIGIVSLSILAFIAGGMNAIYQIEQLPLMVAILIHGSVLYISYLATYLLNSWLEWGMMPILVFSGIFVFGYLAIWAVIYVIIRKRTAKLNQLISQKHQEVSH